MMQKHFEGLSRRCSLLECLADRHILGKQRNGLAIEGLLAAKGGIEARRINSHGGGQIIERGAFVALLPEHLHRSPQGGASVKFTRSTAAGHGPPISVATAK